MIADLVKKLKIAGNMKLLVLNAPEPYLNSKEQLPEDITVDETPEMDQYPFVQVFVKNKAEVQQYAGQALHVIEYDGLLWFCYPKKSSSMFEDLTRDEGWEPVKEAGYAGIASVAIDETWSAMRFRPAKEVGGSKRRSSPAKSETQFNKGETHNDTALTEIMQELEQHTECLSFFNSLAPSYKRSYIDWIASAKREETKQKRMKEMIVKLSEGYKNPYAR
jgi:hypothetical protein